jgi:hypothetical protein
MIDIDPKSSPDILQGNQKRISIYKDCLSRPFDDAVIFKCAQRHVQLRSGGSYEPR